jgi:hypothetical protein
MFWTAQASKSGHPPLAWGLGGGLATEPWCIISLKWGKFPQTLSRENRYSTWLKLVRLGTLIAVFKGLRIPAANGKISRKARSPRPFYPPLNICLTNTLDMNYGVKPAPQSMGKIEGGL